LFLPIDLYIYWIWISCKANTHEVHETLHNEDQVGATCKSRDGPFHRLYLRHKGNNYLFKQKGIQDRYRNYRFLINF